MYFFVKGFILFSKPNFIFYDEWFDDLKEEELDIKEKK